MNCNLRELKIKVIAHFKGQNLLELRDAILCDIDDVEAELREISEKGIKNYPELHQLAIMTFIQKELLGE